MSINLPASVPQRIVDAANAEAKRRIVEAYDTGMRVVADNLRDLLKQGWKPDRESVAEFCKSVEENAKMAKRSN